MIKHKTANFSSSFSDEINFIFHDRYMKILLFIVPAFLLVFVCAMFSNGISEKIPVAVVDYDHSALSREIISNIDASKGIQLIAMPENVEQAQHLMRNMEVNAFVEIPRGATAASFRPDNNPIVIRYNGQFRSTGNAAFVALQSAVSDALQSLKNRVQVGLEHKNTSVNPLNIQIINVSNPQNSYERFLTPIAIPVLLCIVLSSAVICSIGRFFEKKELYHQWINDSRGQLFIAIIARAIPYITIILLWNLLYNLWRNCYSRLANPRQLVDFNTGNIGIMCLDRLYRGDVHIDNTKYADGLKSLNSLYQCGSDLL